jgi:hypothetical protein
MLERNFDNYARIVETDVMSAQLSSRGKEQQVIEGISQAMKVLNVISERFDLAAEKQYLGCYQLSSTLYSACLLIHTKKCGYGVVTILMEGKETEIYMRNLSVVFSESQIFRNIPSLLKAGMP